MTRPTQDEHGAQPALTASQPDARKTSAGSFIERANAGDFEGLVALYEADAVLALPTGDVASGEQAIRDAFQQMLTGQPLFTAGHGRPALRNGDLALT